MSDKFKSVADAYLAKFGDIPWLWAQGDFDAFEAQMAASLKSGTPIPDYYKANDIPKGAVV